MQSLILKRVLCATDFSENAAAALEAAVALAGPSNAEVLVIHVVPTPLRSVGIVGLPNPSGIDEEKPTDVIESLNRLVRPALAAGARIERVLRRGDPGEEIVCEAQRAHADLIVMGRHSRCAPSRWFLGSVAEHVVSKAPCPVMVVEALPRRSGRLHHVLCAVDLGETSLATLTYAAALASALEAELLLLHVVAAPGKDSCTPNPLDAPAGRGIEDARIRLAALAGTASVPSGRAEERVAAGVPYEEILAATHENRIDVVVVGSHGGGIVDRQFIGSTTLHLLRRSECAVLVVPARVNAEVVAETAAEDAPIGVARGVAGREPGAEFASYVCEPHADGRLPE